MARHWTPTSSTRTSTVPVSLPAAWSRAASSRPGQHWYLDAMPLRFRSMIDRAAGGSGAAHPLPERSLLRTGDRVGFWRVEKAHTGIKRACLELVADVRAPGTVRLIVDAEAVESTGRVSNTRISTMIEFEPDGVLGGLYLLADLPAREAVVAMTHRQLIAEVSSPVTV